MPCGMGWFPLGININGDFLETGFIFTVLAKGETQGFKCPYKRLDGFRPCGSRGPEIQILRIRPPPSVSAARRPSDAIILYRCRTRNRITAFFQFGKRLLDDFFDHSNRYPCSLAQRSHDSVIRLIWPLSSGKVGSIPVIDFRAQNQWPGSLSISAKIKGTAVSPIPMIC